ncbi:unnamed protein product [Tuber aestivum]|uniref:Uncharacterized protein n=1 Tax=Tuber aestivum TaxID=59557 RepID=A0A292PSR5_9PEZI|nr:unnamed protein product [Tuber aestivum]
MAYNFTSEAPKPGMNDEGRRYRRNTPTRRDPLPLASSLPLLQQALPPPRQNLRLPLVNLTQPVSERPTDRGEDRISPRRVAGEEGAHFYAELPPAGCGACSYSEQLVGLRRSKARGRKVPKRAQVRIEGIVMVEFGFGLVVGGSG